MKSKFHRGLVAIVLTLTFVANFSFTTNAEAVETAKVTFVPPTTSSSIPLDAAMQFTFDITGGPAAKYLNCADLTGLYLTLSISDDSGNVAMYPWIRDSVEGLWSGYGWSTKVIPNGLRCSWEFDVKAFDDLVKAKYENGAWFFEQSQFDGVRTDGRKKAASLKFTWNSDDGNYRSGSGNVQNIFNQSGEWKIELKGSQTPEVSFSGVERGALIKAPLVVNVQAVGTSALPVTEFNFGPVSRYLLWEKSTAQGQQGQWKQNGTSNCDKPVATSGSAGAVTYSAKCTYLPRDNFLNTPFRATAYTSDHRAFFSSEVYVNTEIMKGYSVPTGSMKLVNDSKGVPVRASILGKFSDILAGTQVVVCIKGTNPSDPSTDGSKCASALVKSDLTFTAEIALPPSYFLEASVILPSGQNLGFGPEMLRSATFASDENPVYECQNHLSGCLTKAQKASLNKSKYAEGYSLINASPASLKSAGFYAYFSANKRMTKANATKFCQSYIRTAALRTDYFDGWGANAISTFIQGCAAAAVKIPYGK